MKKLFFPVLTVLITSLLLCSCTGDPTKVSENDNLTANIQADTLEESYDYQEGNSSPTSYTEYQSGSINFAFNLLKSCYSPDQNTAVTPYNTYLQLSLMANGTAKKTKSEIISALGKNLNTDNLNQCTQYFQTRINSFTDKTDNKYYVNLKNFFWCNDTFDIKREFLKTDKTYYDAEIYRFLFTDENALSKINNRTGEFTGQGETLKKINKDDYIYITSAAELKDNWLEDYAEKNVINETFSGTKKSSETKFYASSEFLLKDSTSTGFIKSFKNTPLKLCVIVPNEDIALSDYIKTLDSEKFINFINSLNPTARCNSYLPAFSKNETVDITEALKKMGINSIFTDDADILNMTKSENVHINKFMESINFSINEKGISSDSIDVKTAANTELDNDVTVKACRPFIYAIIDNESNIPVYLGIVENL